MIGGLSVIAGVGFLLSSASRMLPDLQDQSGMYLASLIAGGMGALLSVLYGMTSGNLRLHTLFANAESAAGRWSPPARCGRSWARSRAPSSTCCCRAAVPLKVPDGAAGTHFFIAIAIVAGFSERWARGVLAGTEERIQTSTAKTNPAPRT